jgi:putative oxidoreductase
MTTSYSSIAHGLLRIVAGLLFLFHGTVKIFGFPPAAQPGQVQPLSLMGVGGAIELVAGTLIMIGLFSRTAAFIASGQMAVAYWMFHAPQNLYPVANQGDAAILYCFIFLFIAAAGPGAWSVDGLRSGRR